MVSLRTLLTPLELAKPWTLYLTPGLLATTSLHALSVTLVARTMRRLFLGHSDTLDLEDVSYFRLAIFMIWQSLATAWLCPLEVVATRLSVQPNSEGGLQAEEEGAAELEYAGTEEDVIGLRPTTEPYEGMVDCARKIMDEEGWESLYRGWWWTMGGNVLAVFG
jgi:hypothetical protein